MRNRSSKSSRRYRPAGIRIKMFIREQLLVGDWIVIGVVFLLATALAWVLFYNPQSSTSSSGIAVEIWQDSKLVYTAPLTDDTDTLIPITSDHGQNQVRLHGLTAQIAAADCADQVCVRTGTLTRVGQTAVCLPHRVIVKLVRDSNGSPSSDKDSSDPTNPEGIDAVAS